MKTFYCLNTCDTCRKARRALDQAGIRYAAVDVRADGLDKATATALLEAFPADQLINRRSTTWRNLPETPAWPLTADEAADLLTQHPTLMKRPVLIGDGVALVGFAAEAYARLSA